MAKEEIDDLVRDLVTAAKQDPTASVAIGSAFLTMASDHEKHARLLKRIGEHFMEFAYRECDKGRDTTHESTQR